MSFEFIVCRSEKCSTNTGRLACTKFWKTSLFQGFFFQKIFVCFVTQSLIIRFFIFFSCGVSILIRSKLNVVDEIWKKASFSSKKRQNSIFVFFYVLYLERKNEDSRQEIDWKKTNRTITNKKLWKSLLTDFPKPTFMFRCIMNICCCCCFIHGILYASIFICAAKDEIIAKLNLHEIEMNN